MTTLENAQHAMTFLENLHRALGLVFGLRSVSFAVQGARALLRKRRKARAQLRQSGSAERTLGVPHTESVPNLGKPAVYQSCPSCPSYPSYSNALVPNRKGGRRCLICDVAIGGNAKFCSGRCERIANCWIGD